MVLMAGSCLRYIGNEICRRKESRGAGGVRNNVRQVAASLPLSLSLSPACPQVFCSPLCCVLVKILQFAIKIPVLLFGIRFMRSRWRRVSLRCERLTPMAKRRDASHAATQASISQKLLCVEQAAYAKRASGAGAGAAWRALWLRGVPSNNLITKHISLACQSCCGICSVQNRMSTRSPQRVLALF